MKYLKFSHLMPIGLLIVLFMTNCNNESSDNQDDDSTKVLEKKTFAVSDYNFAILQDSTFIPYNKAIYHRGDEVFLVLKNVGPFEIGSDSLNHADMKLMVTDAIGQVIILRDSLFGEDGHAKFENNMLKQPFGSYESGINDKPGKYTICLTIYDLVSKDSIPVSDDFFLE
jgi:hypothetical protein